MKLSEFKKPALTGRKPAPPVSPEVLLPTSEPGNASPEAPQEEQFVTAVTPSGIEVYYSWEPRRHYKLRAVGAAAPLSGLPYATNVDASDWTEVPSVTTVLGVLDKSGPLTWWGQGVGVDGLLALFRKGLFDGEDIDALTKEQIVPLLTEHKLTVNHVKDKAADRGVNVHEVLEHWRVGMVPDPKLFPETERGYVEGLRAFMDAIDSTAKSSEGEAVTESELMVGSLQHQYAGRFDLVLTLSKPVEVVTKTYPKRKPKIEEIPAGRYLLDLKTSKRVYDTHFLQLEAYEAAAVECGYPPTDYRGVVHVTEDGRYELALNKDWTLDDFLAVRACYQVMHERKIVQALRDELGAKDAA